MSLGIEKRAVPVLQERVASAQPFKGASFVMSIRYAVDGLLPAWREERGFRRHIFGAMAMLATLVVVQPRPIWWALALLCSALMLALELVNSAIEGLVDFLHAGHHPRIKQIKDMACASVIMAGCGSVIVGVAMILDTLGYLA